MSKDRRPSRHRPVAAAILGWSILLLFCSGLGAVLAVGANGPDDPSLGSRDPSVASRDPRLASLPPVRDAALTAEFGEIAFRVTPPEGSGLPATTEGCALLADDVNERQKGMRGRRDFGGYDAMVFRFETDTQNTFFMRNVPIALSIAWFGSGGRFVSSTDMAPCPDDDSCPQYPPGGVYRFALEAPKGDLPRLGVTPNAVLSLGGACPSSAG